MRLGGKTWKVYDYGHQLIPTAETAEALGLLPGQEEEQQCMMLAVSAALLWSREEQAPDAPTTR